MPRFISADDFTSRPRPVPGPIRNPVASVLLWASKTDPRTIAVCSRWAIATQTALGVFVFFTAVMAYGAAYYTLSTLNAAGSWTGWIALGWSIFVFFLDREIVGGLDKMTAIVRPILALFIGTLVAIPIELFVFQERIDQELQRQYRQDNKQQLDELRSKQSQLEERRNGLRAILDELRKQEAEWGKAMDDELVGRPKSGRTGVQGAGPVFDNANAQQASVRARIQDVRRDLDQLERSIPEETARQDKQFQREEIGKITNFVTRYEAMDKVVHNSNALYRLSWIITLAFVLIEMTPALLKLLTPHVDYHHLVRAEIRENVTRIDEIADRNYRLAIENPESPELSVSEKFAIARFAAPAQLAPARFTQVQDDGQRVAVPIEASPQPLPVTKPEFDQAYLDQLCDSFLHLFGDIPRPTVLIKSADVFDNANAHCRYSRSAAEPCTIEFNDEYLRLASEQAVENTMKHELVHAWIHSKGITDSATHGHVFITKGREVGCDVERYVLELAAKSISATAVAAG